MAGWSVIASEASQPFMIANLAAICTWRYSQGIYRIAPEVLKALSESLISESDDLPSHLFFRLPEWCVYIETPEMKAGGMALNGFWAHLEWDANTGREELRLLLNFGEKLRPIILHLGSWTIYEALRRADDEGKHQARRLGVSLKGLNEADLNPAFDWTEIISPLLSIVLYLCSAEPEYDGHERPEHPPRPALKKTKNGWRLFQPDKPRVWKMGGCLAQQLRQSEGSTETGRKVSPHLRRAHWHGYWTGQGRTKFEFCWIPPIVVGS